VETTPTQYDAPTNAPEASADYSGGTLLTGTYHYAITLTDGLGGETPIGPPVVVTRDPGYASGQVHLWGLTDILTEADAAGWRLYRAVGGGEYDFLAEGSSDTFTDTGSIPLNCAVHPPSLVLNTTLGANLLTVVVPSGSAGVSSAASQFSLYLSEDGLFEDPCLYGTYPPSSAGVPIVIPSLLLLRGAPPLVSLALRGANKIDPDTELIDWHWKRPVSTVADLPPAASGSVEGDVRVVTADRLARVFIGGSWDFLPGTITAQGSAGTSAISIVGSGEVEVSAASASGGVTWTIYAPSGGGGGGAGGSGVVVVQDTDGHVTEPSTLTFTSSGGVLTLVQDEGAGESSVTIALDGQHTDLGLREFMTWGGSAAAASGDVVATDFPNLGRAYSLFYVQTECALRVRLYVDRSHRDADVSRALGTPPTGDHGCVFEHVSATGETSLFLVPSIVAANFEPDGGGGYLSDVAMAVTNLDTSQAPSLAFERLLLQSPR
jgi:hypothetical protein